MRTLWRTHTTFILVGGILLLVVASTIAFMVANFQPRTEVRLGATGMFEARLADTPKERQQGLSGVKKLKENEGLLMVFDANAPWGIWMKDMHIPLDIIWLDENRSVVHIVKDASPDLGTSETFRPTEPARYVLEVNAGMVTKNNIKIGDVATIILPGVKE